jgi:hypothetical protein
MTKKVNFCSVLYQIGARVIFSLGIYRTNSFKSCIKANILIGLLSFCHDIVNIYEKTSYIRLQIFHNKIFLRYLFSNQPGTLLTLDRYSRVLSNTVARVRCRWKRDIE